MPKKKPIRAVSHKSMSIVLVVENRETPTLEQAYRELRYNETVRQYFPRFQAHGPVQSCVQTGRVLFQGPDIIVKKILSELSSGVWRQGTGEDLAKEIAEKLDRQERAARRREAAEA